MNELVSIIMPAFDARLTIKESIQSVLEQTHKDFKLYIIDDCSKDCTVEIINQFKDERILYLKNSKNEGVAFSRNKGIAACSGKYIAFIDSDDVWRRDKLELQLTKLNSGWDVVFSFYQTFVDDIKNITGQRISPEVITYIDMLKTNHIGNLTGVYNAEKIGKILQNKHGHEDYIMWLDILEKSGKALCILENLAYYRVSKSSLSSNKSKAIKWQWQIYRTILKFSVSKSIYYFVFYILNALKKRR